LQINALLEVTPVFPLYEHFHEWRLQILTIS
jgi:hypothetical protein